MAMTDNPYAPPDSPIPPDTDPVHSLRGVPFFLLLAGFGAYCIVVEWWVDAYSIRDVISADGVPPVVVQSFLAGSLALMTGIGRNWFAPWLGSLPFMLAAAILAVGLALISERTGFGNETRLMFAFGIAIALLGAWLSRRARRIVLAHYSSEAGEET